MTKLSVIWYDVAAVRHAIVYTQLVGKSRGETHLASPDVEGFINVDFLDWTHAELGLGKGGVRSPGNEVIDEDEPPDARLVLSDALTAAGACGDAPGKTMPF